MAGESKSDTGLLIETQLTKDETLGRDAKVHVPLVLSQRSFALGQDCIQHGSTSSAEIRYGTFVLNRVGKETARLCGTDHGIGVAVQAGHESVEKMGQIY